MERIFSKRRRRCVRSRGHGGTAPLAAPLSPRVPRTREPRPRRSSSLQRVGPFFFCHADLRNLSSASHRAGSMFFDFFATNTFFFTSGDEEETSVGDKIKFCNFSETSGLGLLRHPAARNFCSLQYHFPSRWLFFFFFSPSQHCFVWLHCFAENSSFFLPDTREIITRFLTKTRFSWNCSFSNQPKW